MFRPSPFPHSAPRSRVSLLRQLPILFLLISALLLPGASSLGGVATFGSPVTGRGPSTSFATPINPVIADFNNDGKADFAVANADGPNLHFSFGNTDGTSSGETTTFGPTNAEAEAAADLDNDGKTDLIFVANGNVEIWFNGDSSAGETLINNGGTAGDFAGPHRFGTAFALTVPDMVCHSLAIAGFPKTTGGISDINGDGYPDIVLGGQADFGFGLTGAVALFRSQTDVDGKLSGYASAVTFGAGQTGGRVAAGDVNGDGTVDVVSADEAAPGSVGTLRVFFGDAVSGLSSEGSVPFFTHHPVGLTLRDVTGDGKADIVAASYAISGGTITTFVEVVRNTGDPTNNGGFSAAPTAFTIDTASGANGVGADLAVADFDSDGKVDVASVSTIATGLDILHLTPNKNTQGQFVNFTVDGHDKVSIPAQAHRFAAGDLNSDAQPDLVISAANGNGVPVLLNTTTGGGGGGGEAGLTITGTASATSDESGTAARIGDDVTYTLTFANNGPGRAENLRVTNLLPRYINASDTTRTQRQIDPDQVTAISPGGRVIDTVDALGNAAKAIVWDVGGLDAGFSQFVSFTIHVSDEFLLDRAVTNNEYAIASTTGQPPEGGDSQGKPVVFNVRNGARITVTTEGTTVAPGGFLTYTLTLKNLTQAPVNKASIVDPIPEHTRFVRAVFLNEKGKETTSEKVALPPGITIGTQGGRSFVTFNLGTLKPREQRSVRLTVQVQFIDSTNLPRVSNIDYEGGFFDRAHTEVVTHGDRANNDVIVSVVGPVVNAPDLGILKALIDTRSGKDDVSSEDTGAGEILNTVEPGSALSFAIAIRNNGEGAAEDVFIQDRLPEGTILKRGSVNVFFKDPRKAKVGEPIVAIEDNGRTLQITGLRLDGKVTAVLTYTVDVPATGSGAPAVGDLLQAGVATIGAGNIPSTTVSVPGAIPIRVVGKPAFTVKTFPLVARPGVTNDVNATANALNSLYGAAPDALPLVAGAESAPGKYIAGVQRYYVHFANSGGVAAQGVTLTVPLPQHTAFYRAALLNKHGEVGPAPNGAVINTPAILATSGAVVANFQRLAADAQGELMVEVLVLPNAIDTDGSFVQASGIEIHDATFTPARHPLGAAKSKPVGPHQDEAAASLNPIADGSQVPQVGIAKYIPRQVLAGATFDVKIAIFNDGAVPCSFPALFFTIPAGAQLVQAEYGGGVFTNNGNSNDSGSVLNFLMASNNGPVDPGSEWRLDPHSAAIVTITLRAIGAPGSSIVDDATFLGTPLVGEVRAAATATDIVAPNPLSTPSAARISVITGADFVDFDGTVLIPLGAGQIVASGANNIVAQGGGNIVAQGGGNIVAAGAGNLVTISGIAGATDSTGAALLMSAPGIVAQGGGNIYNTGAGNLISQDGASLISNDGGSVLTSIANIVAQGGGNIVAQGGGNIVAQGGGNIVAQGGGNIVAQGGGNIFTIGGASIVAQGGGNIVAQGGGNIVAQGGGNIAISLQSSSAIVAQGGGNIVGTNGGNIVAQGGGN
jgi:uncharacterized repeat protein (TIGR01451 family)